MTVPSEINRSGPYNGNGVTVVFDYDFRILDDAHLQVIRADANGNETTLLLTTNYTVTGVGDAGGGSITLLVAPAAGETITILRNMPFTQETDLENQGAYYAETVEDALDAAAMRDQQLQEQLDRVVKIPASSDSSGGELAAELAFNINRLATSANEIDAVAGIKDEVVAVAGIAGDVSLLADVSGVLSGTASAVRMDEKMFVGDGVTTTWTLDRVPGVEENVLVWIGGAVQATADYGVAGAVLTISPAVADGIVIRTLIMTLVTANDIEEMRDETEAFAIAAAAAAAGAQRNFSTVADMVAATDLIAGQIVSTSGYFSKFDGGAAKYEIAAPAAYAPVPAGVDPYVVLYTGQSNAVGYSGATGGVFPSNPNVWMWLATTNGGVPSWVQNPNFLTTTYYVPIAATATYHQLGGGKSNAGLALAHRTQIATGRPVYLILDGLGGRPISEWVGTGSVRYASLRANVLAGLSAIPGSPAKVQIAAWQQGEADSAMAAATYQAALNTVYAQLSAETFWTATTQFIVGKLNPANATFANVNTGIEAFAAENPNLRHVAETSGLIVEVDNIHFTGRALYELGFNRYWDALAPVKMPDLGSRILLANNLVAQLKHDNVLRGEWFGCLGGLESSARLNALNKYAIETRALSGFSAVTVTQNAYVTVKDAVLFGSGSTTSADLASYHIKLNGRIYVVGGGSLEADPTLYALTFSGFETSVLELPFFRADWICNGVKIAGFIRGIVSGGSISRGKETSIEVSGTCSGTNFYSLRAYQRTAADDQSLLNGYALTVDTEDVAFYGGQLGIAKWPLWIRGTASGIHFIRAHIHNGSASTPRTDTVSVMNDGVFNIRFENAYFDNGYVIDRTGCLGLTNCLHLFVSAWVTLTHPLVRVNVSSGITRRTVIDDYRGTVGYYTGGDYMVLDTLGNGTATATASYSDASRRVQMGGLTINLSVPKGAETEIVNQEFQQYYDKVALVHRPIRNIIRKGDDATAWDYDGDVTRVRSPARITANLGLFLGGGFLGMQTLNSQTDLLLGSAAALRWRITDATGSFIPEADNAAQVGSASRRPSQIFAASGTINTSDRREKQDIDDIPDEVLDAWPAVRLVVYRWIKSVAEKGEAARLHIGLIAQEVHGALKAGGVDAFKFGIVGYDEWDADPDSGTPAGNRWSVRETQCLFIEAAYQRRRASHVEETLASVEGRLAALEAGKVN